MKATAPAHRTAAPVSVKIQKVLVPIDFSAAGKPALRYAKSLAQMTGATLCLLHVLDHIYADGNVYFGGLGNYVPAASSNVREHVSRELGALQAEEFAGIKTDFEIREGLPFLEIVEAAKVLKADLIVMATHGFTGLQHLFIGSTAERVVRHAECPVLVVRSQSIRKFRPAARTRRSVE